MNIDHITTNATEAGYLFKCSHCNKSQRLKAKVALNSFNKTFSDFSHDHKYCQPKVDGRGKTSPIHSQVIHCEGCNKAIEQGEAKIPLYRASRLNPMYCHPDCLDELIAIAGKWIKYQIGHHNIIVMGAGEWLYFWRGSCGTARNKAEAVRMLGELAEGSGL